MSRLLISYNHAIADRIAPNLSRDEFCAVLTEALSEQQGWTIRAIAHPYWRCEIETDSDPQAVGQVIVNAIVSYRQHQLQTSLGHNVLCLGGRKTSPNTSDEPHALQLGEWGVDIVETEDVEAFLDSINWEALTDVRPTDGVFKIVARL